MKRRILINASTCVVGGGVQVAAGFLHHLHARLHELGWEVAVVASPQVLAECVHLGPKPGWRMLAIAPSPASPLRGMGSRREIHALIRDFHPQGCFTVFGPSYLWLGIPEVSGFADPSVTNPNRHFLRNHGMLDALRTRFNGLVKMLAVRRVRRFWVETETARRGLALRLGIPEGRIEVIPNVVNPLFVPEVADPPAGRLRFLYLSAFYPHKNHAFLLPVAQALREEWPELAFEFAVTLPASSADWMALRDSFRRAGLDGHIRTLGRLGIRDCPAAYRDAHVVFHPSLLEVFSASYLEAFAARRPLVATDLAFAREACGEAAIYFHPDRPVQAARALHAVATDPGLRARLIEAGLLRLGAGLSAADKNERLVRLIENALRP